MALTATDKLLAGYLGFVTIVLLARGPAAGGAAWLLVAHLLFVVALLAFRRLPRNGAGVGHAIHVLYPLAFIGALYAEIGIINQQVGLTTILRHDAVVQRWEQLLFGQQVSYTWIRQAPSVFWSGLLHFAYLFYYAIVLVPVPVLAARGDWNGARRVLFTMMLAYVACDVVFVAYPVAGPNFAFPHPTGAVREVWSARLVYRALGSGSSVGSAFPSSHVAATVAAVLAVWRAWRPLGALLVVPAVLLTVAVVYCQMHYGVDALTGILVGLAAALPAPWLWEAWSGRAAAGATG
jgi:membrane-associated phospholipid phosphatase